MQDLVSQALVGRAREPEGLRRMLWLSIVVHLVAGLAMLLAPAGWRQPADDAERTVMTISLGGTPGPKTSGMTPISAPPVQQLETSEARQTFTPPAVKTPEMTRPDKPQVQRKPPPKVQQAPEEARSRQPTRGAEVREGAAMADTPGQDMSIGLATGGGGTGGQIMVGDFCCPEYIQTMVSIIDRNWDSRRGFPAMTMMSFVIPRAGGVPSDIGVHQSSGYPELDMVAQRALLASRLPALPAEYPHPQLEVRLQFHYHP